MGIYPVHGFSGTACAFVYSARGPPPAVRRANAIPLPGGKASRTSSESKKSLVARLEPLGPALRVGSNVDRIAVV